MPTFSPANLELNEYVGTTGVTITMNPDPAIFPMLAQQITITGVSCSNAPSDLQLSWANNTFTFSSKFEDMFNKTYKYVIYDEPTNKKTYYSVSKISQISPKITGVYQYIPPANDLMEITFTISTTVADTVEAGGFTTGKTYTIVTPNDTDFTTIGAVNNNAGTSFVASGNGSAATPVLTPGNAIQIYGSPKLVAGNTYKIVTVGTTDWVALGALASTVGTVFTALGSGTGTGQASQLTSGGYFIIGRDYVIVDAGTTVFTDVGAANNNVGTIFTATASGLGTGKVSAVITAGDFVTNSLYQILTVEDTVWTDWGSANNTVGIIFTSTGNGLTENTPGTASTSSAGGAAGSWVLDLRYNSSTANLALQDLTKQGSTYKSAVKLYPEVA